MLLVPDSRCCTWTRSTDIAKDQYLLYSGYRVTQYLSQEVGESPETGERTGVVHVLVRYPGRVSITYDVE